MVDENIVVDAVCRYLEKAGFEIKQRRTTTQRGEDIIAISKQANETLWIEAKGGTSSRKGSARFNKPYTASQVFDRVSKGLYTAVVLREKHAGNDESIGLAFPDAKPFTRLLTPIAATLKKLNLRVYLVSEDCHVRLL